MNEGALPLGPPVDSTPALLPGPLSLGGCFGSVSPLDPERDSETLWASLRDHDAVWTYLASAGPTFDPGAFQDWLDSRAAASDRFCYAIRDRTGAAIGLATLMEVRPAMRVIEVGSIIYSPGLQHTPLGTEAQYLLARYVFETLGYRRYEWKCNALNAASRQAALRYGFVFEGVLRQHMIVGGRSRDTAYFSMLDGEWPRRKANFERWLAPDNFDAAGRQLTRLSALNGQ